MTERPASTAGVPLLLPLAMSFAAGIGLGRYGPPPGWPWLWFLLGLALVFLLRHHRGRGGMVALCLLFCLAGFLRLTAIPAPEIPPSLIPLIDSGQEAVISGHLSHPPTFAGNRGKIQVLADQHWQTDGSITALELPLLLTLPFAPPATLIPGQRLLLRASLHQPSPPGNPGNFDHRQYLAARGINLTGFLRSPAALSAVHDPRQPAAGFLAGLSFGAQRWRQQINAFLAASGLPPREAGLYQALLTGDRSLLPRQLTADFKTSGAFHLLAISGMHLGLLALLSGLFINLLLRRSTFLLNNFSTRKITAALVLLLLLFYAVLAGLQPPVVRALIMAAAFIGALLLDRPAAPANSLGLAALISLAWQPDALFQPSFQLSYLAVAGILAMSRAFPGLFSPPRQNAKALTRLRQWLTGSLAVSGAALLAIAPLTAYHFGQLALLSPLSTLLIAPFLCFWALPLGLLGVLAAGVWPPLGTFLLHTGALGLVAARGLAAGLASLPLVSWSTPTPPLLWLPLYYLLPALLLFGPRQRLFRLVTIPLPLLVLGLAWFYQAQPSRDSPTRATFLDVGQGAATLLELAGGKSVLVDGGSSNGISDFDPGEQLIAPFLRSRGLTRLDALVVSHDHADHYNGLSFIIRQFQPRTVWLNDTTGLSPGLMEIMALAEAVGSPVRVPGPGEIILATPGSSLTCRSHFHQAPGADNAENSRSLVLELESGGRRIILPGDIMEKEAEELRRAGLSGDCAVLLAPHHGSDNSASLALARDCQPAWVIVSAGASPRDHFPGGNLLAWGATNQAQVYQTGVEGAISFHLTPGAVTWQKLSAKARGARAGRF